MAEESAKVPMDEQQQALPPIFEQFLKNLKDDRKRLLKDDNFNHPHHLRSFVGQYLYPRVDEMFRMMAAAFMDSYGLAASNTNELRRLHYFTAQELNRLGADVDEGDGLPGVSPDVLNDFQQSFYALGTLLQEKYPEDQDAQAAFNNCAGFVSEMVAELMDGSTFETDDEGDPPEDDESSEEKNEDDPAVPENLDTDEESGADEEPENSDGDDSAKEEE